MAAIAPDTTRAAAPGWLDPFLADWEPGTGAPRRGSASRRPAGRSLTVRGSTPDDVARAAAAAAAAQPAWADDELPGARRDPPPRGRDLRGAPRRVRDVDPARDRRRPQQDAPRAELRRRASSTPRRRCRRSRTARSCRRVVQGPAVDGPARAGRGRRRDHAVELAERARDARRRAGAGARQRRVLKPDPQTPVCGGAMFAAVFREAGLPEGLLQVVVGGAGRRRGARHRPERHRSCRSPGSTAVGRRVGALAGGLLKKVSPRARRQQRVHRPRRRRPRGGRRGRRVRLVPVPGPGVLRDRPPHRPSRASPTTTSTCSPRRRSACAPATRTARTSSSGRSSTRSSSSASTTSSSARSRGGARVVEGGTHEGLFYRPTVLTDVTPGHAGVDATRSSARSRRSSSFDTDEEAVALANASEYGLVGVDLLALDLRAAWRSPTGSRTGMVHVNDQTLNDEATIPFGGMGASGNGGRYGGEANLDDVHRVAVGHGARRAADRSRSERRPTWHPSPRSPGWPASRRRRRRASSPRPTTRSAPATRARVLEAARTLDYVPNALARGLLKSQIPVVGGHRPRHHRPVLRRGRPRRRGRGVAGRLPGHHLQLRARRRARASYVRLLRSMRAAASIFAGSGLDDPAVNEEMRPARRRDARRRRGGRPPLAARARRAGGRRRQRGRDRGDGRGAGRARAIAGSRSSPGRDRCTSRAQRLAGYRRGLADAGIAVRRAAGRRARASTATAARSAIDTLLAGGGAVHGDLLRQRPARARRAASGWRSSASRSRARSRSRASTTSRRRRSTAPSLSTVRLPLREMGRRGVRVRRAAARRRTSRAARSCRPRSSCADRPRRRRRPRSAAAPR